MEVLLYIAKSALVLSIFYVAYQFMLRKDTLFTAHRHYFLAGIIASILLPFVTFTHITYIDLPVASVTEFTAQEISYPIESDTPVTVMHVPTPIDWWQILYYCYGIGILFMGIRFMVQLKSLHTLIRKNETHRKDGFTHVQVNHSISPFSFFRHIVYNPNLHTSRELKMIITHEKVHGKQWHTVDMVLTQILLIIQWINPLAWLYRKSLEQNLEFIADHEAIEKVASRKEYQMALVKCSSTQLQPAITNNFYHSLIKKRIVMLNKQTSKKHHLLKLGIVLPLLAIFFYSFNIKNVTVYNEVPDTSGLIEEVSAFAKVEITSIKAKEISYVITKYTSEKELDQLTQAIKEHQGQLEFKDIERNENNEITNIFVILYGKNGGHSYRMGNDGNPIDSFIIYKEFIGNGGGYVGRISGATMHFDKEVAPKEIEKFKKKINKLILKKNIEPKTKTSSNTSPFTVHIDQNSSPNIKLVKKNKKEILVVIDDSIASESAIDHIKHKDVHSSKIITPQEAIQKYGRKGKNGAFQIQTKENLKQVLPLIENKSVFNIKITKNTSVAELKKIKKDLKEKHNVDLTYSVNRNEKDEITGLNLQWKDAQGNSGNSNVNGTSPISDTYIFRDEKGSIGLTSGAPQEDLRHQTERLEQRARKLRERQVQRAEELQHKLEERRKALEEKRETLSEGLQHKMKERREALEEQREALSEELQHKMKERQAQLKRQQKQVQERGEHLNSDMEKLRKTLDKEDQSNTGYIQINGEDYYYIDSNGNRKFYNRFGKEVDEKGNNLNEAKKRKLFVTSQEVKMNLSESYKTLNIQLIKKDHSEEDLNALIKTLASQDITCTISEVVRKEKEIHHIKISLKDNTSNKHAAATFGRTNAPIPNVFIGFKGE